MRPKHDDPLLRFFDISPSFDLYIEQLKTRLVSLLLGFIVSCFYDIIPIWAVSRNRSAFKLRGNVHCIDQVSHLFHCRYFVVIIASTMLCKWQVIHLQIC